MEASHLVSKDKTDSFSKNIFSYLKIASIAFGILTYSVGILILLKVHGFHNVDPSIGWTATFSGVILVLIGSALACIKNDSKDAARKKKYKIPKPLKVNYPVYYRGHVKPGMKSKENQNDSSVLRKRSHMSLAIDGSYSKKRGEWWSLSY